MLWRDLASWIRAYFESIYAGYGNQEAVKEKLYRVPVNFNNIFRVIFGKQIADTYSGLISDFIRTVEALVMAQMNGDTVGIEEAAKQLYQNVDQRAAFLSQINPFWQESEWKRLFYPFVHMTIEESDTFFNKEYVRNIEVYDRLLNHTSEMGDYYSNGLFKYLTYTGQRY